MKDVVWQRALNALDKQCRGELKVYHGQGEDTKELNPYKKELRSLKRRT